VVAEAAKAQPADLTVPMVVLVVVEAPQLLLETRVRAVHRQAQQVTTAAQVAKQQLPVTTAAAVAAVVAAARASLAPRQLEEQAVPVCHQASQVVQ
jgi:hypothetical protein